MLHTLKEAVKSVCPDVVLSAYHDFRHVRYMRRVNRLNSQQVELRTGWGVYY
ncbi:MAG: hypothetical protein IJS28_03870 [Synergistaceae bacterium]|nr:hypothetical protein [Synergistaceae bacterium]